MSEGEAVPPWLDRAFNGGRGVEPGQSVAGRLERVVQAAAAVLGVDAVGLMLIDSRDQLQSVAFTDAPASVLEAAQADLGEGPGIDTSWTAGTIRVDDLSTDERYRRLWKRVSSTNLRSVLSCPVTVGGVVVGNFNLARVEPRAWIDAEVRAGEAYAGVVAIILDIEATATDSDQQLLRLADSWEDYQDSEGLIPPSVRPASAPASSDDA